MPPSYLSNSHVVCPSSTRLTRISAIASVRSVDKSGKLIRSQLSVAPLIRITLISAVTPRSPISPENASRIRPPRDFSGNDGQRERTRHSAFPPTGPHARSRKGPPPERRNTKSNPCDPPHPDLGKGSCRHSDSPQPVLWVREEQLPPVTPSPTTEIKSGTWGGRFPEVGFLWGPQGGVCVPVLSR
jgi:hypothetical protein